MKVDNLCKKGKSQRKATCELAEPLLNTDQLGTNVCRNCRPLSAFPHCVQTPVSNNLIRPVSASLCHQYPLMRALMITSDHTWSLEILAIYANIFPLTYVRNFHIAQFLSCIFTECTQCKRCNWRQSDTLCRSIFGCPCFNQLLNLEMLFYQNLIWFVDSTSWLIPLGTYHHSV